MATEVDDIEVLWPLAGDELGTVPSVAEPLPIGSQVALYRVKRLSANGDVDRDEDQEPHMYYSRI
ncbi:hypothetical protein I7X12_03055 [Halosimplex litoreum]|jgi:hypothetical protein|uniref:Uncharacterized protein n=1 Tax=Halosimplex litoreum TaxID=1198301 RepID=A0A7T3FZL4_9EURY|nr:hypothetical protein [Halosimplex litoreum]QPV63625.1 hypothetical protein I7X12_03055 [Halosimplex litoreum]